jgi:restriction system protein
MRKKDQQVLGWIALVAIIIIYSVVKAIIEFFQSLPSEAYLYVGGVLVASALIVFLIIYKRKEMVFKLKIQTIGLNRKILENAKNIVVHHKDELSLRRKQLTLTKNYGLVDETKWSSEKDNFVNEKVITTVGQLSFENTNLLLSYIDEITSNYSKGVEDFDEHMSPNDYEHWVASTLKKYNWATKVTQAVGDQGIDVIATQSGIKLVIQCKLYSNNVGNSAVQEIVAGKLFENANFAVVVTNSSFTKSARQLAVSSGVFLLHHDQLKDLNSLCGLDK